MVSLESLFIVSDEAAFSLEALVGEHGISNPTARFGLVTLYGGQQECLKDASLLNKQLYCKKMGCALYVPEQLLWTSGVREAKRDHYAKLLALKEVMRHPETEHEWLLWHDADTIVWDMDKSPADALADVLRVSVRGEDVSYPPIGPWYLPTAVDKPPHEQDETEARPVDPAEVQMTVSFPINTGCFFVRCSEQAYAFLDRWWKYDLEPDSRVYEKRWNDQGAAIDILWTDPEARKGMAYYHYRDHALAAQIGHHHGGNGHRDWFLHTPGGSIDGKRNALINWETKRRQRDSQPTTWPQHYSCWETGLWAYILGGKDRVK